MSDVVARLERALGAPVQTAPEVRAAHRRDRWALAELDELEGRSPPGPRAVVEPESTAEVAAVLRACRETRTPVVTYGGGSGVCGAIRVDEDAIVLSTARLTGLVALEPEDLVASFRAGTGGLEAEERVQKEGLTIGHWPQSIALATVGGLVATRSAGQYSTGYGNVEDVVLALEAVLPDGSVLRTRATPRAAAGPDLRHLLLGSEGLLGVVTEVTFSLRPLPEASRGQAFHFARFAEGLEAIRRGMRAGWRPPVVRLYDAVESERSFADHCPPGRALLLLVHEGPEAAVEAERASVADLCRAGGGEAAPVAAVEAWLEHRNRVPGFREFLEKGIVVDTIEVAATWSRIGRVYARALEALERVPGILSASAHSSHSYRSGTNLYFTFAARPSSRAAMRETYRACWDAVLEATLAEGGGIAHHHGIGRVRREWLAREIGDAGMAALRALKRALDPDALLNPGALLP